MSSLKRAPTTSSAAKRRRITLGSDFTGLNTTGLALKDLCSVAGLESIHVFGCDKARVSKVLVALTDKPMIWDKDVLTRDINRIRSKIHELGGLDLYTGTAPCQCWSSAGKNEGVRDKVSMLFVYLIAGVEKLQPKIFIMENVATLARREKYRSFFNWLLSRLRSLGYHVEYKVLDSSLFVPQHRERLYIVGIRCDVKRQRSRGVPLFPLDTESPRRPTLASIIKTLPATEFKTCPLEIEEPMEHKNVMKAYKECNVNPFTFPVVIDAKSSEGFSSWQKGICPTLTKTRSAGFGYWASTKGGYLDLDEMAALQGFAPAHLPWKGTGLSASAVAGALGNGQTLPLVRALLPHVLFHACLIDFETYNVMKSLA